MLDMRRFPGSREAFRVFELNSLSGVCAKQVELKSLTQDRPGAGADDFCKLVGDKQLEASPVAQLKGVQFTESRNALAVKEAVATKGPLSIGIDAACLPFRFYGSGVLNTTECGTDPDSIDHAVMLVGYGIEDGAPCVPQLVHCSSAI